ncbi:MAG: adenosine deaminase [Treponema sp.]|nr:adenosine deaminase [Treponema sp.]
MKETEFSSFLTKVPKSEIHLHIEAVLSLGSIKKLYEKRYGKTMSAEDEVALFSYNNLNGFINAFLVVQDLFSSVADFKYVFDDLGKYLAKNNIVYCEAFFAPSAFLKKGFDYSEMISLFSKKIAHIKEKYNITVKLLLDVSRTFGCENAMKNYELLKQYPCKDIIGIGLGGAEQKGPAKEFGPVFAKAHQDGFHAVAHAGEDVGPESVWDSIKVLQAERIGHGITSIQDEKLIEYLAESQLPLEVCITSNVFTKRFVKKVSEHPIRALYDKNVFITVNTDDPIFFKTTLIEEYWKCYSELHFTLDEIKQLIANGFNATFLSDAQKKSYIKQMNAAWKEFAPKE